MNARSILTFTVLIAAAFGSWYLAQTISTDEVVQTISETDSGGFYLRAARILGAPAYDPQSLLPRTDAAGQASP